MIYFLQILLIRHIFWSVNVPIRLGWWKLYHSIFWWWLMMWKKFFFLKWNGTSWNTENCWNFWPNCFGLWGISFWKRKNGSGTPCIFWNKYAVQIISHLTFISSLTNKGFSTFYWYLFTKMNYTLVKNDKSQLALYINSIIEMFLTTKASLAPCVAIKELSKLHF